MGVSNNRGGHGVGPQNGWFIRKNPIKMDDLGGPPLFLETSTNCQDFLRAFHDSFQLAGD